MYLVVICSYYHARYQQVDQCHVTSHVTRRHHGDVYSIRKNDSVNGNCHNRQYFRDSRMTFAISLELWLKRILLLT